MERISTRDHVAQQPLPGGLDPHLAFPTMFQVGYAPDLGPGGANAAPPAATATLADAGAFPTFL